MGRRTLFQIGWRYLLRHPWQLILMVVGITLGVGVAISVDLANASAGRAFEMSTEMVAGRATHQITAGPEGLDQTVFLRLRMAGFEAPIAPVIRRYVSSEMLGGQPMQLLGIDPFSEAPFRSYLGLGERKSGIAVVDLADFLAKPNTILVSDQIAERFRLEPGQSIALDIAGRSYSVEITGLLRPADSLSRRALDGLILADISTAQEITGQIGKLDAIDVILPEGKGGEDLKREILSVLSKGEVLQPISSRSGAIEQMTAAFRLNLTALSLLALIVGMFLIYNTITFSVIQRRSLFGTLRCLGATQGQVFASVVGEALLIGIFGSGLGIGLGILLGQGAVRLVTQTINDLFFVLSVRGVQIPVTSLVKGGVLGLAATFLSAVPSAWEAASVPPKAALSRSSLETKAISAINLAAGTGVGSILSGILTLSIPTRSLVVSFTGTLLIVIGNAMLVPLFARFSMQALIPVLGRLRSTLGRMAPRDVAASLSRTSIAMMALMVAISVTIGVSLMVSSFRFTVVTWLQDTLQGDIYISAPSLTATTPTDSIDPRVVELSKSWPGVERVDILRSTTVESPQGSVQIAATNNLTVGSERIFASIEVPPERIWDELKNGAVIVSEPFATRMELPRRGAKIAFNTPGGTRQFAVVAVYYDYASTQGTVLMALPVYQEIWDDYELTAIQLRLEPGVEAESVVTEIQDALTPIQKVLVRDNQTLKQEVLVVFDRTFAITGALQMIATVVAFIGILSALLALEMERQRELGILRAIGMTVRQLRILILSETGLMGIVSGLLSMPAGYVLALILVFIINKRSFGWTLQMQVEVESFLEAFFVAVAAAFIAGIYPAIRIGKIIISDALRSE